MPQNIQNTNKVALITGSAKRIGAAIAQTLHAQGWNVIIHYHHSTDAALTLTHTLNQQREESAYALQADLMDTNYYAEFIEHAHHRWQRLDALINNAATFFPTHVGETSIQQWNELMTTNVMAPFFLSQTALPYLRKYNGNIINIIDTHANGRPLKHHSVYSISKAALLMQTQSLAREVAPDVRVNAVAPGVNAWNENELFANAEEILNRTPLQRAGNPEEIANAVRYLLLDATYTTGSVIYVDGGRCVFN